ncbi:MAG: oxidoreductase [Peptoniphilaceae bacterium]|nr:oxidoreductase [Peptoniphilaceae bacterium]MDD7382826.1 oxidoreductase [Peptoniphilaceae bacterium]MDY3738215.1 oxidoreductase [Peptoniphilaceae bacterium]
MNRKLFKFFKKNRYILICASFLTFIIIFLLFSIFSFFVNRDLDLDNDIVILQVNGKEKGSFSKKEIMESDAENISISLGNGYENAKIEGVDLVKLFDKLKITPSRRSLLYIKSKDGEIETIPMSTVLEPKRVFLIYKINKKRLTEYNKDLGSFAIMDVFDNDTESWIKNVKTINIQ